MILYIILILVLIAASYTDIKTHTVPLYLWLIPIFSKIIYACINKTFADLGISFICAFVTFVTFFIMSYYSTFGGADVLLLTSIAFILDVYVTYAALFSFILVLPYTFYMAVKKIKKEYPFVPYILAGTFLTIVVSEVL